MSDTPREQRLRFGEVAEIYDRVRLGYPKELFDDVFDRAPASPRAVEVGGGTGRASQQLAPRVAELVVVEPDAAMASIATRRLADAPHARVVTSLFEDGAVPGEPFALLFAAQAWHWVPERARVPRATAALVPGGVFAACWNRSTLADAGLRADIEAASAEHAPSVTPGGPAGRFGKRDVFAGELEASGAFRDVGGGGYGRTVDYSPADYLDLLRTQSDHRLLTEAERARLLDAIAEAIAARGDLVRLDVVCDLLLATRAGSAAS